MPILERPQGPSLHYEVDDFTDAWKNAPYIFLQHGMGRSSRLWYGWVPYLSRFFKVVRTDLRGYGGSSPLDKSRPPKIDDYIGDLLAIMDQLGADSVHYCGDSFGGIIGMVLAATHPGRVRTLTLLSSPVYLDEQNVGRVKLGRPTWHAALTELGPKGWAEALHDGVLMGKDADPKLAAWFAQDMGSSRLETLLAMAELAMASDATPFLPRISAPVLGLYPTHGTLTSSAQEELLRKHVRNLTYVRLPSKYHMAQHIAPASCARLLLHFAAQHDGTTCHE